MTCTPCLSVVQMCASLTKHLLHCEAELNKFAYELKEKGQLKTPLVKTDSAASISASLAAASAAAAATASTSAAPA